MPSVSDFGFSLTLTIRGGWIVELSRWWLRQNSAKRSHTSSSRITASEWTDAATDTPPTPAPADGKGDDISQRVYDLPTPSQKSLLDYYERDNDDAEKDEKFAQKTFHVRPLLPLARQIRVPRGIKTYPYLPKRRFPTTMNVMTPTLMKKTTRSR